MGKSNTVLKYLGAATVIYLIVGRVVTKITNNLTYGFKSLRLIDFWSNIPRGRLEMEAVLTIENFNTTQLEVTGFDGYLMYEEERMVQLIQNIPVILKPKTRQPIRFTFKLNILEAVAKFYLAMSDDKKRLVGTRIVGDLSVVIDNIPLTFPYDAAVTIDL